jgi:hypothetical protein
MSEQPKALITLTLELPSDRPRDVGFCLLRKLLKGMLRSYGLRLIDIREQQQPPRDEPGRDENQNTT